MEQTPEQVVTETYETGGIEGLKILVGIMKEAASAIGDSDTGEGAQNGRKRANIIASLALAKIGELKQA